MDPCSWWTLKSCDIHLKVVSLTGSLHKFQLTWQDKNQFPYQLIYSALVLVSHRYEKYLLQHNKSSFFGVENVQESRLLIPELSGFVSLENDTWKNWRARVQNMNFWTHCRSLYKKTTGSKRYSVVWGDVNYLKLDIMRKKGFHFLTNVAKAVMRSFVASGQNSFFYRVLA